MTPNPYSKNYRPPSKIESFLWFCAGADGDLLPHCPNSDRTKYQGIGGIIFATGILAFVSSSYAFWTVFSPKTGTSMDQVSSFEAPLAITISILAGIVWGLVIFNIDRFIVSSTGTGDGTENITFWEVVYALPRLFMAGLIGICLSTPLELRILKPEIDAHLELKQREHMERLNESSELQFKAKENRLSAEIKEIESKIEAQKQEINERQNKIDEQYRLLELEAEGKTSNGIPGRGPAWQDKKSNLDRQNNLIQDLKNRFESDSERYDDQIADRKKDLGELREKKSEEFAKNKKAAYHLDGLLARIDIAEEIGGWMKVILSLLLVSIEVGPIFFKMMIAEGAYDYLKKNKKLMTCANNGLFLERRLITSPEGKTTEESVLRSLLLEKQQAEQEHQLQTELELTKKVHLAYRKKIEAEIDTDVNKFLGDG